MNIAIQILLVFIGWIIIPILEILWTIVEFPEMEKGRRWGIFAVYCIFGPFSLMLPGINQSDD
jgi:hypothetical protein